MLPDSDIWAWIIVCALGLTGLIVLIQSNRKSEGEYLTDVEDESKEVILPDGSSKSWADFQADTEKPSPETRDDILREGIERYKPVMDRLEKAGD